jgi:hypothetical protein
VRAGIRGQNSGARMKREAVGPLIPNPRPLIRYQMEVKNESECQRFFEFENYAKNRIHGHSNYLVDINANA